MKTKTLILLGTVVLCLAACGNKSKAVAQAPTKPSFTLPEVPAMLQSVEDRIKFVVQHYWEQFDFRDTTYIHYPDVTEQALVNYMELLKQVEPEIANSCVKGMLTKAGQEPKMLTYFTDLLHHYWMNPNSPMYSEMSYQPVAEFLSEHGSEAVRSKASFELKMIRMNQPGSRANDFTYTLSDGRQYRLSQNSSAYTLLLLYDPECENCQRILNELKASRWVLQRMEKDMTVIAVYPYGESETWKQYRKEIPTAWVNGYDKGRLIESTPLYDLKAMPTLYLLDKEKRVILKDCSIDYLEEWLYDHKE